MTVFNIDCETGMAWFPDNTFDSIVCDPPYELGFMGKAWDSTGIAYKVAMWREALRVLKPGGHLLAFSSSRTYHRMTCAIEDAGFDIRDQIMWIYGSGFPKSLDVSKAIDKASGAEREVVGSRMKSGTGGSQTFAQDAWTQANRGVIELDITAPATAEAQQWRGWGTALKPAHEPICVARKPLIGTVAANVLQFGTGAINIDACRVGGESTRRVNTAEMGYHGGNLAASYETGSDAGRWPANVIHDGSDEVLAAFPAAPGQLAKAAEGGERRRDQNTYGAMLRGSNGSEPRNDAGSAARFFYCPKASRKDRNEGLDSFPDQTGGMRSNTSGQHITQRDADYQPRPVKNNHPTVKPTELMRYLVRLVTPPGGCVLDPFAGSGSTGKAAILEGRYFVGFELSAEYAEIANARMRAAA